MDQWIKPFEPTEELSGANSVLKGSEQWDKENGNRLLRILTVNMHGRPVDVAHGWFFGDKKVDGSFNKSNSNELYLQCDDEWSLINAQDRRMRGFFEWLDTLPEHVMPHVLCFQEIMWHTMIDIAEKALLERGFTTLKKISLDQDRGCKTAIPPRMGSGLGIYVRTRGLQIVDGDSLVFSERLGADVLVNKGFKWALVRCLDKKLLGVNKSGEKGQGYFVVITCHPQAYNQLYTEGAPGESAFVVFLRKAVRFGFDLKGGFPLAITYAHHAQYTQIRDYIRDVLLVRVQVHLGSRKLRGVFLAADMNVNRYAAAPESGQEGCIEHASTPQISREFQAILNLLQCGNAPKLLMEPLKWLQPPNQGRYTWDARENSVAKPIVPGAPLSFAWIDSVLACGVGNTSLPQYIDNRALVMHLPRPIPEISPFWTSTCVGWRNKHLAARKSYLPINYEIRIRLKRGHVQQHHLKDLFKRSLLPFNNTLSAVTVKQMWRNFILNAPYAWSSQLWKGLAFYGIFNTDIYVIRETNHLKIGDPHPFRMISDVSDHHAVMGRIIL